MNNTPAIAILMATYNGGNYITEQLESLLSQTYTNWKLIVRDDGSDDDTVDIISKYAAAEPRISWSRSPTRRSGACANFSALFSTVKADEHIRYVMFCDQDDIWKPRKIERSISKLLEEEKKHPNAAILVYSDLELMNGAGMPLEGDLKLKHRLDFRYLLTFNYVYGCTIMMNRNMIHKIGSIPASAVNHDYWIALVASMYKSSFINEKLTRYRMHSNNASGNVAGNNSWRSRLERHLLAPEKEISGSKGILAMLENFYKLYCDSLPERNKLMIRDYLDAFGKDRLHVCYKMLSYKLFKKNFFTSLASFCHVLFYYDRIRL